MRRRRTTTTCRSEFVREWVRLGSESQTLTPGRTGSSRGRSASPHPHIPSPATLSPKGNSRRVTRTTFSFIGGNGRPQLRRVCTGIAQISPEVRIVTRRSSITFTAESTRGESGGLSEVSAEPPTFNELFDRAVAACAEAQFLSGRTAGSVRKARLQRASARRVRALIAE